MRILMALSLGFLFCGSLLLGDAVSPAARVEAITLALDSVVVEGSVKASPESVPELVDKLRELCRELPGHPHGINFVLIPGAEPQAGSGKPSGEANDGVRTTRPGKTSGLELLRSVGELPGWQYRIEEHAVVVAPAGMPLDKLEVAFFGIELGCSAPFENFEQETESNTNYFRRREVNFPAGTYVWGDHRQDILVAVNTPEELARIEDIYIDLKVYYPQSFIEYKILRVAGQELRRFAPWREYSGPDKLSLADYRDFIENANYQTIAESAVMTYHGTQEGVIWSELEKYLPEWWRRPIFARMGKAVIHGGKPPADDTDDTDEEPSRRITNSNVIYPQKGDLLTVSPSPEFSNHRLGFRQRVTPNSDADLSTVSMDIGHLVQSLSGWDYYPPTLPHDQYAAKMPRLHAVSFESRSIYSAAAARVLDGGINARGEHTLLFVSPMILNSFGETINSAPAHQLQRKHRSNYRSIDYNDFPKLARFEQYAENLPPGGAIIAKLLKPADIEFVRIPVKAAMAEMEILFEAAGIPLRIELAEHEANPEISLSLKNTPLGEIARYLAMLIGTEMGVDENFVALGGNFKQPMPSREFRLSSIKAGLYLREHVAGIESSANLDNAKLNQLFRGFFQKYGVQFPLDSELNYNWENGTLSVRNTPGNMDLIKLIIRLCEVRIPIINVSLNVLDIAAKDLEALVGRRVGPPPPDFYHTLMDSGKARLIAAPRMTTISGATAITKSGNRQVFPESWSDPKLYFVNGLAAIDMPSPEFGGVSNVGVRFEMTPSVFRSFYPINLNLNHSITEHVGWTEYPVKFELKRADGENVEKTTLVRMPEFKSDGISTNVLVHDGHTVCVGMTSLGFDPEKDEFLNMPELDANRKVRFYFVTATLFGEDGQPLRAAQD